MKADETSFNIGRPVIVIMVLAVILLLAVILFVFILNDSRPDEAVFSELSGHTNATLTKLVKEISFLGNHRFLIPANFMLIAFFLIKKDYWWAIRVTVVALSSLGIMSLLKKMIQRDRPPMPIVDGITNYGFPSGHALMSIAFYGLLIVIAGHFITDIIRRRAIIFFLGVLIFLIGFSRVYLRVHYTTDVIAGWSVGILWMVTCLFILEKIRTGRTR